MLLSYLLLYKGTGVDATLFPRNHPGIKSSLVFHRLEYKTLKLIKKNLTFLTHTTTKLLYI